MFSFFKGSVRELKHVVWPTKDETKKYFIIVLSILVLFWLYLFLASNIFSSSVFFLKDKFWNTSNNNVPNFDLWDIQINTWALSDTWVVLSTWSLTETWSISK